MAPATCFFLLLAVAWWSSLQSAPSTVEGVGFSIGLVHRDSSLSPFYNESDSPSARTRQALRRSNARAGYLASVAAQVSLASSDDDVSISSKLTPVDQDYFMALSIGTPPVQILAFVDTGSDLVWTQCKPCKKCYKQDTPLFEPRKSSSFRSLGCSSNACKEIEGTCSPKKVCEYSFDYEDDSYTKGVLASESFTFGDEKKMVSFPGISFGCGHDNEGLFNEGGAGLVGLGRGATSLVQQLSPAINGRFSYCLVPSSKKDSSSHLSFGDDAVVSGAGVVTLPMLSYNGPYDYYLSLEEIRIGDSKIPVRKMPFPDDPNVAILVDSGTSLTYLRPSIVDQIKTLLAGKVRLSRTKDPRGEFELCYQFHSSADESAVPDVVFQFKGGSMALKARNTFVPIENGARCLGVLSSQEVGGVAILGSLAQQNFHVGYDLKRNTVSFVPAECSKI